MREEEYLRKIGVTTEKILTKMAHLAFADIRKIFREDGTLLLPHEWPDEAAAAVAGVADSQKFTCEAGDLSGLGVRL